MTILISVLSEAFSSKYHDVLRHGVLEKTVKILKARIERSKSHSQSRSRSHSRSRTRVAAIMPLSDIKASMEKISGDLVLVARMFHEHVRYFSTGSRAGKPAPETLQKLLNDIAESEQLDKRVREELLQDEEASKASYSYLIS